MKYKALFTVEILHDYYAEGNGGAYVFIPTTACLLEMQNIGAFYKVWGNELYVIIKEDGTGKAWKSLPLDLKLEFYVQPADPVFFEYTQLSIPVGFRYYWHNHQPRLRNGIKYMHVLPPVFNPASQYVLGQFVTGPGDACFEALVNLNAGSNLGDTNQWANRGILAYADSSGLLSFYSGQPLLEVSPAAKQVDIEIYTHVAGGVPAGFLVRKEQQTFEEIVSGVSVNLADLKPGLYKILVNGSEKIMYADSSGAWHDHIGIVAVGHYAHLNADYKLTEADGTLLSPKYSIRLAPLNLIWRYEARTEAAKALSDETNAVIFDQTGVAQFTSRLPVRLGKEPYRHMILEYNNTSPPDPAKTVNIKNLPVPNGRNPGTIRQNDTDYLMATTKLFY